MNLAHGYKLGGHPHDVQDIAVSDEERSRGQYVIGLPGSGKTSGAFKTQIVQDIAEGRGFALLDVEDTVVDFALRALAAHGTPAEKVVLVDPTRSDQVVPLNFLKVPPGVHPQSILEGAVASMKRVWWDAWGPRTDDLTRSALALLMEHGLTLADMPRVLSDKPFRDALVERSTNERIRLYFQDHLAGIRQSETRTWFEAPRNKADAFVNPFLEPFLSAEDCVDIRRLMDENCYLLVRAPEAQLKDAGRLFVMLLTNAIYQAALSRPEGSSFWPILADEYQSIATQTWEHIGTRCRKRGVGVVVAHQSTSQSPFDRDPSIVDTLLNVCCVSMFFQLGRKDAERFARDVFPVTGTAPKKVKKKDPFWGGDQVESFYSVQEEIAQYATELEQQSQRQCFIKIRRREGIEVWVAEAYEVPELSATADDAAALADASLAIHGVAVEATHKARIERLDALVPRKGKGGRPARVALSRATQGEDDPYAPL